MDVLNKTSEHPTSVVLDHLPRHDNVFPTIALRAADPYDAPGLAQDPVGLHETSPADRKPPGVLVVDWDGPDDPKNPKNWSFKRKWTVTVIVSAFTFIAPVSSSIVAATVGQTTAEFRIHSNVLAALTTSIFVLGYAIGPLLLGPLSEIYGRSRVLQLSNLWFLAWNLGCGFAQNESQLLTFRFLAGLMGGAAVAIGGGILGDCWHTEERGQAVAVYSAAPLLGPVIGPIAGAWIAERSTWRWVFWSTSIADAVVQLLGFLLLQETYAPVLLERKAEQIRKSRDRGRNPYIKVRTIFDVREDRSWKAIMVRSLVRSFMLLCLEPIIQLLGVYMAFVFGILYLFLTTMPSIFESVYRQPVGMSGLHYIALGIGLSGASQLNARSMDKIYVYLKNKHEGVGRPEFRLPAMFLGTVALPIGLLITGWTVETRTSWIGADIGIALVGTGIVLSNLCIQAYVIDAFTLYAASAMAAVLFLRSLAGCGFPLFASELYTVLGYGKGNTLLAVLATVLGCPAPWIFWHFGERIRNASRYASE